MKLRVGLLALLLAGCGLITGDDGPRVAFRTDLASYTIGEVGVISLANLDDRPLRLASSARDALRCAIFLERREADGWRGSPDPFFYGEVCISGMFELAPSEAYTHEFVVTDQYFGARGVYRFAVVLSDGGGWVMSDSFRVD